MKYVIVCGLIVTALALCLVSCFGTTTEAAEPDPAMFTLLEKQQFGGHERAMVFVHNDTGVMYLFLDGYRNGGLTIMVDADGEPLIYSPEQEAQ